MTTVALAPRPARSLYSGMILALIALALALQASFVAGLAGGRGGFAPRTTPRAPAVIERASSPGLASLPTTPCAIP